MALLGAVNYLKYFVAGLTACGVVAAPVAFVLAGGDTKNQVNQQLSLLTPVDTEAPNRQTLGVQVSKLFENVQVNETKTYNFSDISLSLGDYKLQKDDLLVSPKQDGIYYLARALGGNKGFKLDDGRIVQVFRGSFKGRNYKNIKLDWKTSAGSFISRVTLGTCKFTVTNPENREKQLTIACSQFQGANAQNGEKSTATISESEFKNFVS